MRIHKNSRIVDLSYQDDYEVRLEIEESGNLKSIGVRKVGDQDYRPVNTPYVGTIPKMAELPKVVETAVSRMKNARQGSNEGELNTKSLLYKRLREWAKDPVECSSRRRAGMALDMIDKVDYSYSVKFLNLLGASIYERTIGRGLTLISCWQIFEMFNKKPTYDELSRLTGMSDSFDKKYIDKWVAQGYSD